MNVTASEVEIAGDVFSNKLREYLKCSGWRYTCETPGSFWLWEKVLPDGRVILVNQEMALSIQAYYDEETQDENQE